MTAYLFAGQGSQYEGMCVALADSNPGVKRLYEEGSDLLGYDVLQLDAGHLAQTRYAQPAIFLASLAAFQAYRDAVGLDGHAIYAGLSLGEYTALAASGRLGFADGLRLVEYRSHLMQESCDAAPGAMSAVLGLDADAIQACLAENQLAADVYIANRNAPLQSVIAGPASLIDRAGEALSAAGARRVARLAVSGAFHTRYMADAAQVLKETFGELALTPGDLCEVYSNVYAAPLLPALQAESDPSFAAYLERHMTHPVRWVEEIHAIEKAGAESYVEFGPGKVLAGLVGKILPGTVVVQADHFVGSESRIP